MRFSSLFVASLTVAGLSMAPLLYSPSGAALAQTAASAGHAAPLPDIRVDAPKRVVRLHRPEPRAVARSSIVSRRTSVAAQAPSATPAPESVSAKLAKLASATGSCVGGCVTSFRSGNEPWHGCSGSAWPALSPTCRNTGNFKTFKECMDAGLLMGWRVNEAPWYCSSLALK